MAGGRAEWNDNTTKIFLDLCIAEKEKHNFHKKGLTKQGLMTIRAPEQISYSQENIRVMEKTKEQEWGKVGPRYGHHYLNSTMENSAYEQFRNRGLAHKEELITLFGSMDSEDGEMLCVGGLGDRTPSGGSDDNIVGLLEDNAGWSEKEQVVDSPPTKKRRSMEYYVERISDSMVQSEEMTELLQLVEADGVSLDSELYFIAIELLWTTTRRIAFRSFTTAEQRIAWLRWTWDNVKNK
ncbi:hypothetical protein BS78_04G025200 [Paspalum vaginatum]|nr:hypothetical protein BS78_04G025200 [Paspalum vaginatum]